MAELSFSVAQNLAASLITIGHPYQQAAINATAMDLVRWCNGILANGVRIDPEKQAQNLVDAARTNWEDGWPSQGGTARLYTLFREMFGKPSESGQITYEQLQARGLIDPPCEHCDGGGYTGSPPFVEFCRCAQGRHQRYWQGERGLLRINTKSDDKRKSVAANRLKEVTREDLDRLLKERKKPQ